MICAVVLENGYVSMVTDNLHTACVERDVQNSSNSVEWYAYDARVITGLKDVMKVCKLNRKQLKEKWGI